MSKNIGKFTTLIIYGFIATILITSWNGYESQLATVSGDKEKHVCMTDIGKDLPDCIELTLAIKAEAETGLKVKSQPKQSN